MTSKLRIFALLALPFFLVACSDSWTMVRTSDFPYGNERTAGTGPRYILEKMMPARALNLEAQNTQAESVAAPMEPASEAVEAVEITGELNDTFREKQIK